MELTKFLAALAVFLPIVYGAPTSAASSLHPEILAAMKRDLGLDSAQAHARVAREIQATEVIEQIASSAGNAFGGAWLVDGELNVAVTDEALASEVSAAGATPFVVSVPLSKLEQAKKDLDALEIVQTFSEGSKEGIASWFVDVAANKLVLEALSGSTTQAADLAKQVGLAEGEFSVVTVNELPKTFATVRGGDAYYINRSGRCSVGFSVTTGFVTAGHCGRSGATTTTSQSGGTTTGTFAGSVFPGSGDYAFVRGASGNTFQGRINNYAGGTLPVSGSSESAVGSSICRSGSTTGVRCGTVQAKGATVNYSQGAVTGMTRTSACAEPGDSGGSWYTGAQAQGVTSGGSGNCQSGGTTFFQPLNEILSAYGLTLVTG